jgi:hypothetical protein
MITAFVILLALVAVFPRLLQVLGVTVWIIAGLLWWHWPSEAEQKARIEAGPAPIEHRIEQAEPLPPRSPPELDFRPAGPDGKPPSRMQR